MFWIVLVCVLSCARSTNICPGIENPSKSYDCQSDLNSPTTIYHWTFDPTSMDEYAGISDFQCRKG